VIAIGCAAPFCAHLVNLRRSFGETRIGLCEYPRPLSSMGVGSYDLINANRSSLIVSGLVVCMPWGKPL
jgi:hypothetical protein